MSKPLITRRKLLSYGTALPLVPTGLFLSGCQQQPDTPTFRELLDFGRSLTMKSQRLMLAHKPLVRELPASEISATFPSNGTHKPAGDTYQRWLDNSFTNWRLAVDGMVERPLSLKLDDIKSMPARSQITQHNCDEGWSAVGQWKGVPLATILMMAGLKPDTRFIIFHCSDGDGKNYYYESIDLFDAFHPQTILAYEMNGEPLPVQHGAPIRLRVELQIGYKNAKYIERIEAANTLRHVGKGGGGYWEDKGFQWYAGL
ncbi:molybdopterin-dependent oxidoreductase [Kordiimonas pumila]|uniref:Molybdopterin-dependent oxidoreductase n=1 Tax=Kordiimonas pumila TaxID=2161677 RepID=A0ABV7D4S7_9PROT|nr:molybdopterin-dependent oxidoreductase [Kordiimonas pumila]